ncbi:MULTISPECIES: MraY family glycosyltransferase [Paenibacillus]|uniref:Undecaprenyl-phosphate alpha-N-acetylglucosaminyl 1-phosphate transferase n=1 Tax=Paenibacillus plantarum TaxID=2654975 RepID=A0ABX1XI01_9BACL|nr:MULTISPECIES: MraY family glycosyltransferase [Paenibacillus]MEC0270453.1 MraY family glycosyltransferase [Paenibacillus anseongense]NOU67523.1 undecaprenyl-phosphate alpha-N-acetylglucosaminyl 1-phosphate transferase [Paenibacillus plantarum]
MFVSPLIGFIISGIMLVLIIPLIRRISIAIGAVAVPNHRTMHSTIMPRLGGLAIFISFISSVSIMYPKIIPSLPAFWGLLVSAFIIEIVGVLDDVYTLSAKWKLLGQILSAVTVALSGFTVDQVHIPFAQDIYFPGWFSILLTVLWIVGLINALNWIDGLDGLATGIAGISCITLCIIAGLTGNMIVLILSATLLGSLAGFYIFNSEPASIFMGESGSAFLGFVLAVISILGFKQAVFVSFIIPLLILGVPLLDTLLAMTRRGIQGRPLYEADRGHVHHRLTDIGVSRRSTVYILFGISSFLGMCAILLTKASTSAITLVMLLLIIALLTLAGAELVGIFKGNRPFYELLRKLRRVRDEN